MSIVGRRETVIQENARPPFVCRIRGGLKRLTKTAAANPQAVAIFNAGREARKAFSAIEKEIIAACPKLSNPLTPVNDQGFVVSKDDLKHSPQVYASLMELADSNGKLSVIPIVLAGDTVEDCLVDRYEGQKALNGQRAWSEFGSDGERYCMSLPPIPQGGARSKQTKRVAQVQGKCEPNGCKAFGAGFCKYKASLYFRIPGISTAQPFLLETSSDIATAETWKTLKSIVQETGTLPKLVDGRPVFALTKKEGRRTYINQNGELSEGKQWVPTLLANVDIAVLSTARQASVALAVPKAAKPDELSPTEDDKESINASASDPAAADEKARAEALKAVGDAIGRGDEKLSLRKYAMAAYRGGGGSLDLASLLAMSAPIIPDLYREQVRAADFGAWLDSAIPHEISVGDYLALVRSGYAGFKAIRDYVVQSIRQAA